MINSKTLYSKKNLYAFLTVIIVLSLICPVLLMLTDQAHSLKQTRAKIFDINEKLLADNTPAYDLWIDPSQVTAPKELIAKLITVFPNINTETLSENLNSGKKFAYIKRLLTLSEVQKVRELKSPILQILQVDRRTYPYGHLFSHILGMTDIDLRGITGVEQQFDKQLTNHESLILTLDASIQSTVYQTLDLAVTTNEAKGGAAIVMNANTAEILAMVSIPDFDPVISSLRKETMSMATNLLYEFGSLLTPFAIANALENNIITITDRIDASESLTVGGILIKDTSPKETPLSIAEILKFNSKIALGNITLKTGQRLQCKFFDLLGFNNIIFSDISSVIPVNRCITTDGKFRKVSNYESITKSYGYGIALTPLHIVNAYATLINGGNFREPTIIKGPPERVNTFKKVMSKTSSKQIEKLLQLSSGNTHNSHPRWMHSAKSIKSVVGGYDSQRVTYSSISAFPYGNQKIVVFVMLDEPKMNKSSVDNYIETTMTVSAVANIINKTAILLGKQSLLIQK